MPKLGTLTKVLTDPPIWFISIEGSGRIELSTEDLQNQRRFQLRLMQVLNVMPVMPKAEVWQEIVHQLLTNCHIVEIPMEATPHGQLKMHLMDFCTNRAQAKNQDEILLGKPYTNAGFHYIRIVDFLQYLARIRFNLMEENKIIWHLKNWADGHRFINVKGKGVNTWFFREFPVQVAPFDQPVPTNKVPY
jgi:hypothetical protein